MTDFALALGRVMMAAIFIVAGVAKLTAVGGIAGTMKGLGLPYPELFGYAVALFEIIAGAMIAIGLRARATALVLFVFTAVTIYVGHNFWDFSGAEYFAQRTQALKNLAIMGGLLYLAATTPGRFSLDRR